jgi:hypothetical protein
VLIHGKNINLIIARETIHQGEDLTSGTFVNDLVNERGGIIFFRTRFIYIPIIYAHVNRSLFIIHWNKIGYPISQSHKIDKANFKNFFNFKLDSSRFTWMEWVKSLLNRFNVWICLNILHHDIRINTWHFLITQV